MVKNTHGYELDIEWLGNRGSGTSGYREYGRQLVIRAGNGLVKHDIEASADTPFRGDADRWNPEELLLGALAQCHMLSYLFMAVQADVVVTAYTDHATGTIEQEDFGGHFTEVVLHPVVTVANADMVDRALAAHAEARRYCFIANSVNFPVRHEPEIRVAS